MSPKSLAKTLLRWSANLAVSPALIVHAIKVPFLGRDRALEGSSELLALLPGMTGQYLRRAFLGWTIAHCHPSAFIGFGTIFSKADVWIGENVYIGPYCSLGNVRVERDTLIATGTHLLSGAKMHGIADVTKPIRLQPGEFSKVTIGEDCWIGSGAVIMADVGPHTVIAAGAIVTKPIPEMVIAGGVPARVIRSRLDAITD
ncbi:acyltransferase [Zavarzinella formosa]|uniref:acyltransferase n=1 Tax=Zavarzinella formosa TaxID=360055 RepID=UPI0003093F00|nr:acyltransferase [Zavarzinella formosa]